jgi:hypothetical protein
MEIVLLIVQWNKFNPFSLLMEYNLVVSSHSFPSFLLFHCLVFVLLFFVTFHLSLLLPSLYISEMDDNDEDGDDDLSEIEVESSEDEDEDVEEDNDKEIDDELVNALKETKI